MRWKEWVSEAFSGSLPEKFVSLYILSEVGAAVVTCTGAGGAKERNPSLRQGDLTLSFIYQATSIRKAQ